MGAHENPVQATRSSKRRASAAHSQQLPTAKKRVVLGDLTNSLNLGSFRDSDFGPNKPKCTLKWKEEEEEEEEEDDDDDDDEEEEEEEEDQEQEPPAAEIAVSSMVHAPKCGYSNSIYKHLRAQEVQLSPFFFFFFFFFFFSTYLVDFLTDWDLGFCFLKMNIGF
jgi:hypothetical protein